MERVVVVQLNAELVTNIDQLPGRHDLLCLLLLLLLLFHILFLLVRLFLGVASLREPIIRIQPLLLRRARRASLLVVGALRATEASVGCTPLGHLRGLRHDQMRAAPAGW